MSVFVFRSDDFSEVFATNSSSRFISRLQNRTSFGFASEIRLLHLRIPPIKKAALIYVNCSCACYAQVGALNTRLLQLVSVEASELEESYTFSAPLSRTLCCPNLDEIKFTLRASDGKLIEFEKGTTTVFVQIE